MKVHEYQAKEILSKGGVPVPPGRFAASADEAAAAATDIKGGVVVKAQVHAGGRGKAGGIRLVSSPEEAHQAAESILGSRLVTHQTGPEGVPVRGVLVEEALDIARELYLGIVVDGSEGSVVVMASEAGGVDIEEVAEQSPEKILRTAVDPLLGLQPFQARRIAYQLKVETDQVREVARLIENLAEIFLSYDCALAEINPLVVTSEGTVLAADAKLVLEDDALFRHSDLAELQDPEQEDPLELRAQQSGVSYVKLDGDVGCMVNGAGLAMATMDVIGTVGAAPANFLDVGGGANEGQVAEAMAVLLSDPDVDRVLINIFGGILSCDVVARGILAAAEAMSEATSPMVVRMQGTNADEGRKILDGSSLDVTLVATLAQAAEAIQSTS